MKRPNASGSAFPLRDGRWRAQQTVSLEPRRYVTRTFATEAEARAFIGEPPTPVERFWALVERRRRPRPGYEKLGPCWEWTGSRGRGGIGYGQFAAVTGAPPVAAHRFAWELAEGPIPAGLNVLHRCDNVVCVRRSHLFLGTQADNVADMIAKGRQAGNARVIHRDRPTIAKDPQPMAARSNVPDRENGSGGRIRTYDHAVNSRRVPSTRTAPNQSPAKSRLRRLLFPAPRAIAYRTGADELHDRLVLALVGILAVAAPLREMWVWGPAQGCRYVFAGLGFGCRP